MFYLDSSSQVQNYFSGIAYSTSDIILSLSGLEKYYSENKSLLALNNGRYSLVLKNKSLKKAIIMTDLTGQDTLFYYQKSGFWAISNSLYKLVKKLIERGDTLEIYRPSLFAYKVKHSIGLQPISNNTIIDGIKILARNKYFEILDGEVFVRNRIVDALVIRNNDEYITNLVDVLSKHVSALSAIIKTLPKGAIRCDLTGGLDSRFLFSLISNTNLIDKVKVSSNFRKKKDYLLANYMAGLKGLVIDNSSITEQPLLTNELGIFELYKKGNSGVYSGGIYKPSYHKSPATLHLHGGGGEALRGQYVGTPRQVIGRLESHFSNREEFLSVKKEFLNYFLENNLDINDPKSMLIHARHFLSRFHFGRNWYRMLTNPLFTPMCDIHLEALSDYLIEKYGNPRSLFYDVYQLLAPLTAYIPFDQDEKNIKLEDVELFLERKGANNIKLKVDKTFSIYGELGEDDYSFESIDLTLSTPKTFDELVEEERRYFLSKYVKSDIEQFKNNIAVFTLLNLI